MEETKKLTETETNKIPDTKATSDMTDEETETDREIKKISIAKKQ